MQRALRQLARKFSEGRRIAVRWIEKKGGYGLVAQQRIPAKTIIASYPVEIVAEDRAPKDSTYTLNVFKRNWHEHDGYVGRVTPSILRSSLQQSERALPEIGLFTNEASRGEVDNARIVFPTVASSMIAPGMIAHAKIQTIRTVRPGEEILVCYGALYKRDYRANVACK